MTKTELVLMLSDQLEISSKKADEYVKTLVDIICDTLANDEKVVITGLGTFEVRVRAERRGRDPRYSEEIIIPAQKSPAFIAGKQLKEAVKANPPIIAEDEE
jgi:DNA-binding protein HU-beta